MRNIFEQTIEIAREQEVIDGKITDDILRITVKRPDIFDSTFCFDFRLAKVLKEKLNAREDI